MPNILDEIVSSSNLFSLREKSIILGILEFT